MTKEGDGELLWANIYRLNKVSTSKSIENNGKISYVRFRDASNSDKSTNAISS